MAIELPTDLVLREFLQDLLKQLGVAKDPADFIMIKAELLIPITLPCAILCGNKVSLRYPQMEERAFLRDAFFIAAL